MRRRPAEGGGASAMDFVVTVCTACTTSTLYIETSFDGGVVHVLKASHPADSRVGHIHIFFSMLARLMCM